MAQVSSVSEFDVMPSTVATSTSSSALGKDEFLNLLVTQMRYQDPLEPSSDTEFIAQMAQFSSLEQMQNLNNTFSTFQNYSMVGKYVTARNGLDNVEGYVQSITQVGEDTYALVDGISVNVNDIFKVTDMAEELQVLTGILQQIVESNYNNSGNNGVNDPGDEPGGDDPTVDPGENPGGDPGDNPGDDPTINPGDNPGDDPIVNPGDEPGGDDPIVDPGDDSGTVPPEGNNP